VDVYKLLGPPDASGQTALHYRDRLHVDIDTDAGPRMKVDVEEGGLPTAERLFGSNLFTPEESTGLLSLLRAKRGSARTGWFEATAVESDRWPGMVTLKITAANNR
jgi:hypothetical protein